MIKITLSDGFICEYEKGMTVYQIALSISEGFVCNVLAVKVNG
jgi:threonyl-tRNA synthetase